MCGIFGLVLGRAEHLGAALQERIDASLAHRGPDGFGTVTTSLRPDGGKSLKVEYNRFEDTETRLWVLHRRLSIIDLRAIANQPFVDAASGISISVNGEIYNFRALRAELEGLGHVFTSNSDSEVILHGYKQWRLGILERLEGMFGLAIVDAAAGKLVLARDRFGIKPLYVMPMAAGLAFSSELPALRHAAERFGHEIRWNPQALYFFLRHGTTGLDGETLFQGIRHLLPATLMECDFATGRTETRAYWRPGREVSEVSYDQAVETTRTLFIEAVESHLMADVPVATTLSGGMDSTAILSVVCRVLGRHADVFSFVNEDPAASEERWIDIAAEGLDARLHKVALPEPEFGHVVDVIRHQGEPFAGASVLAQNAVHRAVAGQGFKVVLDGQGADEMMAGYMPHVGNYVGELIRTGRLGEAARRIADFRRSGNAPSLLAAGIVDATLPVPAADAVRRLRGANAWPAYLNRVAFERAGVRTLAARRKTRGEARDVRALLNASLYDDSIPQLLRYADRNAMMYSIENRVPFLDYRLSSFLSTLPIGFSVSSRFLTKSVFRDAMRGIADQRIIERPDKVGFTQSNRRIVAPLMPEILPMLSLERTSGVGEFLDAAALRAIRSEPSRHENEIWRLFNLAVVAREWAI